MLTVLLSGEESSMRNLKKQIRLYFMLGKMNPHCPLCSYYSLQKIKVHQILADVVESVCCIFRGAAGTGLYCQRHGDTHCDLKHTAVADNWGKYFRLSTPDSQM